MFLVCGPKGFECARPTSMRMSIIFRVENMNARRHPTSMYPNCMNVEDGKICKSMAEIRGEKSETQNEDANES